MSQIERPFTPWPKIPRLNKALYCIVTEKIDGSNAQVVIEDNKIVAVGSRSRWITPESDNFGFAGHVQRNSEEFLQLGEGSHFGEWYGNGIQRKYGLKEKRFVLFNALRWRERQDFMKTIDVVPILYEGQYYNGLEIEIATKLEESGSIAVPGFTSPEGFVIYFPEFHRSAKWTYEAQEGKWKEVA